MFITGLLKRRFRPFVYLGLAGLLGACSNPLEGEDHEDAVGVDITDMAGGPLASYRISTGTWTIAEGAAFQLQQGVEREVRIYFVDADDDRFQEPASGAEYTHRVVIAHPSIAAYEGHDDHGHFEGLAVGSTTAVVQLYHGSHADFATNPGMPIEVVAAP